MTPARWRWTLRTSFRWPSVRHKIIASTKASSIARAISGFARMSGAAFARWPAASCSCNSRDTTGAGGLVHRGNEGGVIGRPMIASLAAARSSGVSDMVPHPTAERRCRLSCRPERDRHHRVPFVAGHAVRHGAARHAGAGLGFGDLAEPWPDRRALLLLVDLGRDGAAALDPAG